jgi:hypothetical protein
MSPVKRKVDVVTTCLYICVPSVTKREDAVVALGWSSKLELCLLPPLQTSSADRMSFRFGACERQECVKGFLREVLSYRTKNCRTFLAKEYVLKITRLGS